MKKILILSVCLLALVISVGFSQAPSSKKPDFTLKDLSGKSVSLESLKGSVVLLTFFTTWCPSFEDEMPKLEVIYQKYKSKGFLVVGIAIKENKMNVQTFVNENKLTFPVLLDEKGNVATAYNVRYIPRNFIFDKNGEVKFSAHYLQPADLEKEILKVLQ